MTSPIQPSNSRQFALSACAYAGKAISDSLDRRTFERKEETMFEILDNPPPQEASTREHNEYRRSANDALRWVQKNRPLQYESYQQNFVQYLQDNVNRRSSKEICTGAYTHQYSYGAPDQNLGETITRAVDTIVPPIARGVIAVKSLVSSSEETKKANDDLDLMIEIQRQMSDDTRERDYRASHNIPDTPPRSPSDLTKKLLKAYRQSSSARSKD